MDAPEIEARLADLGQELQAAGVGQLSGFPSWAELTC
jgi:hypothetical protein